MIIYLDLDGVLSNFHDAACAVHGWDCNDPALQVWNFSRPKGLTLAQFWQPLDNYEFWAKTVQPDPWAGRVVQCFRDMQDTIIFCSTPSNSSGAWQGKLDWIRRQPWYQGEEVLLMGHKERLADGSSCLVDDNQESVNAFRAAGGNVILFPQPWNDCKRTVSDADIETLIQRMTYPASRGILPVDAKERKARPMYRGLLCYFPRALAEVSHISYMGNEQHHPGTSIHWDKTKSTDQEDALLRHLAEYAATGDLHSLSQVAWRALAALETALESTQ